MTIVGTGWAYEELERLRAARLADAGVIEGLRGELVQAAQDEEYAWNTHRIAKDACDAALARVAELTGGLDAANQHCKILGEFRDAAERRVAELERTSGLVIYEEFEWTKEYLCESLTEAIDRAEAAERRAAEAQRLIGKLLDVLCLPGHALTADELQDACVMGGRYCEPFISCNGECRAAEDHKDAERWQWARRNLAPAVLIEEWQWPDLLPIPEDEETDEHIDRMADAAIASRQSGEQEEGK